MSDGETNPFKAGAQFQAPPTEDTSGAASKTPFAAAAAAEAAAVPGKAVLRRKVRDLNLGDPKLLEKNRKVADLTVKDLNDLAAAFQGVAPTSGKIAQLTIEDMQDLEGVFLEYKLNAARELSGLSSQDVSAEWSVSCCCCTPCCSCAATEVDPIRA